MSSPKDYGVPGSETEVARFGEIVAEGFAIPPTQPATWFALAGHENIRTYRHDGEIAGGFVLVPMAQFWGGRSVRMCGFAGVAISPHMRGRGVATRMMQEGLRELRAAGWPTAGLFPATQPLYRRAGFEQAGARFELRGPLTAIAQGDRKLPMRPFAQSDLPGVQAIYSEVARTRPGWLDRGPYIWHRVQNPRGHTAYGYVLGAPGEVEAYVFLARVPKTGFGFDILITDMASRTSRGWQRLMTFVRDHDSLGLDVVFHGGADDPRLLLLEEQRIVAKSLDSWMIRILDVERALSERGYPRGPTASLHLQVQDDLFADNCSRFVLEVSGREARVRRGGEGSLVCDVRALAALFSGYRSATELARFGIITAAPEAAETADVLFGGPMPSMPDMF